MKTNVCNTYIVNGTWLLYTRIVLTNNYCCDCPEARGLTNIGDRFTNIKKTPCVLNVVAPYLSMKVVTTGRFCRASDISACVVRIFILLHLAVHACIACYTRVLDATRVHTHSTMPRVFLSLQCACHTRATRV